MKSLTSSKPSFVAHTAIAVAIALSLSACGGGGGNTKSDTSSIGGNPVIGSTCSHKEASNYGASAACEYVYKGEANNLLYPTKIAQAHAEGYSGKGVKVAVLDTLETNVDSYAPLVNRIAYKKDFTTSYNINEDVDNPELKIYHGSAMASIIGGVATNGFNGGVAQNAELYLGRICWEMNCQAYSVGQAINEFGSMGVRLFNLSIGAENSQFAADWFKRHMENSVLKHDALVVSATGNSGGDTPNIPAALPSYNNDLINNWLAVANVRVDNQGNVTGLSTSGSTGSNKCGMAMSYCLSAVGQIMIHTPSQHDYWKDASFPVNGTSSAAAVITGVSALVWEAYPWMSASNVQQTLLTTATDLGDAGVDSVYGWGLVNAQKAVHGPAQFTKEFSANVTDGYNSVFSNNISGVGGLNKTGNGTLVLSGDNSFSGLTQIDGGVLNLSGRLTGSVENNAGFYATGGSIGGNYTAETSAVTGVQVGKPLKVGGSASVDGTLHLLNADSKYTIQSTEKILSAASVDGTFKKVTYANDLFWNANLSYSANEVSATMNRTSAATAAVAFAMDQSVVDGAKQVDTVVSKVDQSIADGSNKYSDFSGALAGVLLSDTATAASSLSTLTGSVMGSARTAQINSAMTHLSQMSDHIASSNTDERSVWGQHDGANGSVKRVGYANANWDRSGVTGGVDLPYDWGTFGAVLSAGKTNVSMQGDRVKSDDLTVSVWAHKDFNNVYANALLSATHSAADATRTIFTGTSVDTMFSSRKDKSIQGRLEVGLNTPVAPFVAVGAVSNTQGAFSEQESAMGLTASSETTTTPFAEAGIRFIKEYGNWYYSGALAYQHLLAGRNLDYNAAFVGMDDATFNISAPRLANNRFRGVVAGGYKFNTGLSVYGQVGSESATEQKTHVSGELGVRWSF